jgi:NADPH-dependent 2,4-dienoyl-CoA reductase/sulfur reductase-like enzyme
VYAALPTFKQDVADYLKYLQRQACKCGARVLLNTEATQELLEKEHYDAVIVAIGAEPIVPKLPGIDLPHVQWAPQADAGEVPCGQKVVVVGAGAVGMEAAIDLKKEGKDVTVIELLNNWSSLQKSASGGAAEFFAIIKELDLDVRLGHKLLEVTPEEVVCENVETGERVRIPADTVLLAMGVKPRWAEADKLRLACPGTNAFLIGDCLYVGDNIKGATSGALTAAAYL